MVPGSGGIVDAEGKQAKLKVGEDPPSVEMFSNDRIQFSVRRSKPQGVIMF